MSQPWMKFYPTDWRADPRLRMCSIAARGLWMEMLCIMHESEPRGSLLINGHKVQYPQLARLAGISEDEVGVLLGELAGAGVFSKGDNGELYSRRMRRDEEKAATDKANGGKGGNPRLKGGVNPGDKAQIPEARVQIERTEPCGSANADATVPVKRKNEYSKDFEAFWLAYPRSPNMSKDNAWKVWKRLSPEDRLQATAAVPVYKSWISEINGKRKDPHPIVHAERFLSQRRFEGFGIKAETITRPLINVLEGTEEMDAWDRHWRQTKGVNAPRSKHGGIFVETQWPPGEPNAESPTP